MNIGRVQLTSSPEFVVSEFEHKFDDWISNEYWIVSFVRVATVNGGTKPTGLPGYQLVELSTTICQRGFQIPSFRV
mgnify:FL=1